MLGVYFKVYALTVPTMCIILVQSLHLNSENGDLSLWLSYYQLFKVCLEWLTGGLRGIYLLCQSL